MAVKIALTIGLVVLIVMYLDPASFARVLTWKAAMAVGVIQLALLGSTWFCAYRHAILVARPRAPVMPCAVAMFLSAGLNLVMPGRISELIKATYLRLKLGIPLANGTSAIVVERLFDICVVALIGLGGFVGLYDPNPVMLISVIAVAVMALLLLKPIARRLLPWFNARRSRFWGFVADNCRHVLGILNLRISLIVLLCTMAAWGIHYLGIWLFFAVQPGFALDFSQAAIVFCAIIFAGAVPALPGGIGLVQAAVTLALMRIGFTAGDAFALSVALHVAELLMSAIAAPIILLVQPTGIAHLLRDILRKPEPKPLEL